MQQDMYQQTQAPYKLHDTSNKTFVKAKQPLSVFDVKELYDAAYDALDNGTNEYRAKKMMAEAIKADMLYRVTLARDSRYQPQSETSAFQELAA